MSEVRYKLITATSNGQSSFSSNDLRGRTIKAVTVGNTPIQSDQYSFAGTTLTIEDDSVIATIDTETEVNITHQWEKRN